MKKVRTKMIKNKRIEKGKSLITNLRIDNDFILLVQPMTEEEKKDYVNNSIQYDNTHSIYVWKNVLIYNYDKYCLCNDFNIKYTVIKLNFNQKAEALEWVCKQELERNNLTVERKKYLIGKRFEFRLAMLAEKNSLSHIDEESESSKKYIIASNIGKDYDIHQVTVYKYMTYAKAIDELIKKDQLTAKRILLGDLRMSHVNVLELAKLPKEDIHSLKDLLHKENQKHISYADIKHELQWRQIFISQQKNQQKQNLPIKQVPQYDPDSEIASLSLTIPSWIGSINRTHLRTNFDKVTCNGRRQLEEQLECLKITVDEVLQDIKEEMPYEYR